MDLANHYALVNQPEPVASPPLSSAFVNRQYVDPGDDTTVTPGELINPAAGEALDEEDLEG